MVAVDGLFWVDDVLEVGSADGSQVFGRYGFADWKRIAPFGRRFAGSAVSDVNVVGLAADVDGFGGVVGHVLGSPKRALMAFLSLGGVITPLMARNAMRARICILYGDFSGRSDSRFCLI